ncbi:hypothetical protein GCM10018779_45410 [Streptomyces griseocarneus]|nr:hypothetical protein GCM10018779_45410 [Streptomyces griseocarneus]
MHALYEPPAAPDGPRSPFLRTILGWVPGRATRRAAWGAGTRRISDRRPIRSAVQADVPGRPVRNSGLMSNLTKDSHQIMPKTVVSRQIIPSGFHGNRDDHPTRRTVRGAGP